MKEVEWLEDNGSYEEKVAWGYTKPGWYFWDETWSHAHGPYETESEAIESCNRYVKSLG